jgi:hypothetical protein
MRDDDPIPLKHAAEFFDIGVSTLKARIADGTLAATKPGREYRTSLNDVREMFEKCRVTVSRPDFTVTRRGANSSSETAAASIDSATQALSKLRNLSRNTSPESIGRSQARVR